MLILSAPTSAGPRALWCVRDECAADFSELSPEAEGELLAVDAVGNATQQGLFCSWRGARVSAVVELTRPACDEARRRLDAAAAALARAGLVRHEEWPRVVATALRGVLLYPARRLEVPRGEELVAGVYVPGAQAIHLTSTLEAAPHELFHAVLRARGGGVDHDSFPLVVEAVSRAFRAKYRGLPVL